MTLLSSGGRCPWVVSEIVAEAVSWQMQLVHRVDHVLRIQLGVLVIWVGLVDGELDCLGDTSWEERSGSVLVGEELSPSFLLSLRVVVLNEAASAAY